MYTIPRAGGITLGGCGVQTINDRFGPHGKTAVRDRERCALHMAPLGMETPVTWPGQDPLGYPRNGQAEGASIYHVVPSIQGFRNNLTALSQFYNLYFVAYQGQIFVYRPRAVSEQLLTRFPDLRLAPPRTKASNWIKAPMDFRRPHTVNHVITGMLGEREVVVACFDTGDVVAYDVKEVWNEILCKDKERGVAASRGVRVSAQPIASTKPMLNENVGKSAWGLAVHPRSRLIAVSSNLHEITVFAMAISTGSDSTPSVHHQTSNKSSCEGCGDQVAKVKQRQRTWRIVIALAKHASNIPNISFIDDDEGEADKVCGMDINGKAWIADIWKPLQNCTYLRATKSSGSSPFGHRGWGALPLPTENFLVVRNVQDLFGGDPKLVQLDKPSAVIDINPMLRYNVDDPCSNSRRLKLAHDVVTIPHASWPPSHQYEPPNVWTLNLLEAAAANETGGLALTWQAHPLPQPSNMGVMNIQSMITAMLTAQAGGFDPTNETDLGAFEAVLEVAQVSPAVPTGEDDDMPDLQSVSGGGETEDGNNWNEPNEQDVEENTDEDGTAANVLDVEPMEVFGSVDEDYGDDEEDEDDSEEDEDEDYEDDEDDEDGEEDEVLNEALADIMSAEAFIEDPNGEEADVPDPIHFMASNLDFPTNPPNPFFPMLGPPPLSQQPPWPGAGGSFSSFAQNPADNLIGQTPANLPVPPPLAETYGMLLPTQAMGSGAPGIGTSSSVSSELANEQLLAEFVGGIFGAPMHSPWTKKFWDINQWHKKRPELISQRLGHGKKNLLRPLLSSCCKARYLPTSGGPVLLPMVYLPHEGVSKIPEEAGIQSLKVNTREEVFNKSPALADIMKRYRFLLTYEHDLVLLSPSMTPVATEQTIPDIRCSDAIPELVPDTMQMESIFEATERLSFLVQIPELSLLVIGSATGRVLLVTPTRMEGPNRAIYGDKWQYGFRVEAVLPRQSDEAQHIPKGGRRPLHGVAVGPALYGSEGVNKEDEGARGPKRFRVVLHYRNHEIWTYEVGREKDDGRVCIF